MAQAPKFDDRALDAFTEAVAGFEVSRLQKGDIIGDMLRTSWERTGLVPQEQKSDQMWFNQVMDVLAEVPAKQQNDFIKAAAEKTNDKFGKLGVENFAQRYLQPIEPESKTALLIGHMRAGVAEIVDGFTPEQQQQMASVQRFEQRMARFAPNQILPTVPENPQTDPEQIVGELMNIWKKQPDQYHQAASLTLTFFDESRNAIHDVLNDPVLQQQRQENRLAQIKTPDLSPVAPPTTSLIDTGIVVPDDRILGTSAHIFVERPKIDNQSLYESMLARRQATLVDEVQNLDNMPRNNWAEIEKQMTDAGLYKDPKAACKTLHDMMIDAHRAENPYRAFNDLSTKVAEDPSILGDYQVKREGFWENMPFMNGQQWAEDRVKFGAWQKVLFVHDAIRTESSVRFQTETVVMHKESIAALMDKGPSVFDLLDKPAQDAPLPDHDLGAYRGRNPSQERRPTL